VHKRKEFVITSVYKQQLKDWVATLDVKAEKVIDIGGSQDPIKGRTRSWEVDKYLIADLPDPHIKNQSADIILNIDRKDAPTHQIDKCDMLFCLEVFDYIRDPMSAFANISDLLHPDGTVYITFPLIYPIHNPIEDEGLRFTEPAIRYYGDKFAMPVQEIVYRKPNSHKLLEYYAEDGFRAAPNYNHNVIGYIVRFKKL